MEAFVQKNNKRRLERPDGAETDTVMTGKEQKSHVRKILCR